MTQWVSEEERHCCGNKQFTDLWTMLAVGRVLTLTRTKYGPQAHVHWYCATGGIPVDLHTLAVSIVSKKEEII